jgi:hypothetical protein
MTVSKLASESSLRWMDESRPRFAFSEPDRDVEGGCVLGCALRAKDEDGESERRVRDGTREVWRRDPRERLRLRERPVPVETASGRRVSSPGTKEYRRCCDDSASSEGFSAVVWGTSFWKNPDALALIFRHLGVKLPSCLYLWWTEGEEMRVSGALELLLLSVGC